MAQPRRILIVEDHPEFGKILKEMLVVSIPDLEVILAESGKSFKFLAESLSFDVVILDISLPDENGLHLAKVYHEKFPSVPIVIFTSHDQVEYKQSALAQGARYYLVKGQVPSRELIGIIEQLLLETKPP